MIPLSFGTEKDEIWISLIVDRQISVKWEKYERPMEWFIEFLEGCEILQTFSLLMWAQFISQIIELIFFKHTRSVIHRLKKKDITISW